jgi:hypothetical protein
MRPLVIATLALLMAVPAWAKQPPSAYLERQHSADKSEIKTTDKDAGKERCRVVKEWKVGEVIAQHRICDDPPELDATVRKRTPPQR